MKFNSEISRFFSKVDALEESWCRINLAVLLLCTCGLVLHRRHPVIPPERMLLHANIKYNP